MKRTKQFIIIALSFMLTESINAQFAFLYSSTGMEYGKANTVDTDNNYINAALFQNTININPTGSTPLTAPGQSTQIALTKYTKNGQLLWGKTMGGTATSEGPHGVACDADKNIYMTGYFGSTTLTGAQSASFNPAGGGNISTQGNEDCFVAKYNQNGDYQWAFGLGNAGAETQERAWDIAVESNGDLYVGGGYHGTMNFNPFGTAVSKTLPTANVGLFLTKYNTSGACQWVISIAAECTDVFTEGYITFDSDNKGGLFVAGNFRGTNVDFNPNGITPTTLSSSGLTDIFIAKYNNSDGTLVWVKKIGGAASEVVSPGALRCDKNGNPYFTGRISGTGSVDFDPTPNIVNVTNSALFLSSFDTNGNMRFASGFASGAGDGGHRIGFDSNNNVYLAGWMNGTATFGNGISVTAKSPTADAFLAKFSNSGTCQWAFSFGGEGATANNICAGLAVDQQNNIYLTGQLYGANADFDPSPSAELKLSCAGNNDCFVAKYTSDGQLWKATNTALDDNYKMNNTLQIYPTLVRCGENIHIKSENIDIKEIFIFNNQGQLVYSSKNIVEFIVSSSLIQGNYYFKIVTNKSNIFSRILIY